MNIRWITTGLVLALSAAALHAQSQSPARPIFTSSIDLARLDVVVTDKDGKPIQDLRPEEVRVTEGADARPVLMVQHIAEAGRTYAESALRTVAAEVSTNQGAPRGQLYVLLFDQEHMSPGVDQKVRIAAEKFIKTKVQPQDRIALYGLPAPGPALSFTNNTRAAIDQLQSIRGDQPKTVTAQYVELTLQEAHEIMRGNEEMLTKFLLKPDEFTSSRASALADLQGKRSGETQESLRRLMQDNARAVVAKADGDSRRFLGLAADVLHSLRTVDGRKTVLLFSEGFYADNVASELRAVSAAAAESYSVIYAFDLNDRTSNPLDEPGASTATGALNRTESIGGLAADTNGVLITDAANRLDSALEQLGAPNNDYYIVAFQPSADAMNDRTGYRKVDVKVTRPGAVVHTRTGYTAGVNARIDPSMPALRRITIDQALAAPYGHQGLKVEYTTYESHGAAGSERIILSLETELPVADGATAGPRTSEPSTAGSPGTGDKGPGTAAADVVFVVRNSRTGQVATSGADQIALPSAPEPGRSTGLGRWRVQFTLPPGEYLMRCIVREPGGLLGSADRQFTVRALGGPDVAPSDLMLGRPGPQLPVRATGYTAEPLPAAVRVFGRSIEQLDKISGRLELVPIGGTTALVGVSATPTEARDVDGQPLRDLFFELPLAKVPAGEYVARAEIRSSGEFVSELRRQVTVIDGPPPLETSAPATARLAPAPSEAADSDIAKTIMASPALPSEALAKEGVTLLRAAKYAEAAAALRTAFDADPKNARVAFVLGWAERGQNNMTAAVSAFRNAAVIDPAMIPAHLALADTYLEMKQPALAIQALEAGLVSQPNAVELKRLLEMIRK
jgi:VWFA-related protein